LQHRSRRLFVLLTWCLLLILAWGLWLWRLDASDLTYDESCTYYIAHRPLADMLEHIQGRTYENPSLYYLLIHCRSGALTSARSCNTLW
jgi:hypothetical protein